MNDAETVQLVLVLRRNCILALDCCPDSPMRCPILFVLLGCASILAGCFGPFQFIGTAEKVTEVSRRSNSSKTVDAVLICDDHDAGATGGTAFYKVLVVPRGQPAIEQENNLVLEVTDCGGYGKNGTWQPEWRGDNRLLVRLKQARVWRFTNYVWDSGGHTIGVRLLVDGYGES